jgi:hypothetical protein
MRNQYRNGNAAAEFESDRDVDRGFEAFIFEVNVRTRVQIYLDRDMFVCANELEREWKQRVRIDTRTRTRIKTEARAICIEATRVVTLANAGKVRSSRQQRS